MVYEFGEIMLIDFNELSEITIPNMNGGEGEVIAKMDVNDCGRFIQTIIPPNSSIGPHLQKTNDDINFIVSGEGIAVCDDEEMLAPIRRDYENRHNG